MPHPVSEDDPERSPERIAGIVLTRGEHAKFILVEDTRQVLPCGPLTRLIGAPREVAGIALVDGEVVPVLKLWDAVTRKALLCEYDSQRLALTGFDDAFPGQFVRALPGPSAPRGDGAPPDLWVHFRHVVLPVTRMDDLAAPLFASIPFSSPERRSLPPER